MAVGAPELAAPVITERALTRVAFIVPDHEFTAAQIEMYTAKSVALFEELFENAKAFVPTDRLAQSDSGQTPLVVVVNVAPESVQVAQLEKLGDWARQVSSEVALPEVGVVVGGYYYPFKSIESI